MGFGGVDNDAETDVLLPPSSDDPVIQALINYMNTKNDQLNARILALEKEGNKCLDGFVAYIEGMDAWLFRDRSLKQL